MGLLNLGSRTQPVYNPAGSSNPGQVTLINLDPVNPAYVDYDYAVSVLSFEIGPLNSLTFDGTRTLYANAPVENLQLLIVPGATGWTASPVQAAIQIAASGLATADNQIAQETGIPANMLASGQGVTTEIAALIASGEVTGSPGGVPLLTLGQQLYGTSNTTIAANGSLSTGVLDIPQIGFEAFLDIYSAATLAAGVQISVVWFLNGTFADQRSYYIYPGTSSADPAVFIWNGTSRGNQCEITITNLGNGTLTIVGFQFNQNSRVYPSETFRSTWEINPATGLTMAANDIMADIICAQSSTVGASSSVTFQLPMYAGRCIVSGSTNAGDNGMQLIIKPTADPNVSPTPVNLASNAAGIIAPVEIYLPYAQCELELINNDAASHSLGASIIAAEY
jgi:hypothetical protein